MTVEEVQTAAATPEVEKNEEVSKKRVDEESPETTEEPAAKKAKMENGEAKKAVNLLKNSNNASSGDGVNFPAVKKQIEYYLSDANLKSDKFFHGKISEAGEGWLKMEDIMACNKIKSMKITSADIKKAVEDSSAVEVKEDCSAVRRAGNKALPELKAMNRTQSKGGKFEPAVKRSGHDGGCMLKVSAVKQETIGWGDVKHAVKDMLIAETKPGVFIWYASQKNEETSDVCVGVNPFPNDIKFFNDLVKNGKKLTVKARPAKKEEEVKEGEKKEEEAKEGEKKEEEKKEEEKKEEEKKEEQPVETAEFEFRLMTAEEVAAELPKFPQSIKDKRTKNEMQRKKNITQCFKICDIEFKSMKELKSKVKDIQTSRTNGEELNKESNDFKLVKELLTKYHPTGAKKAENMKGIKVDISKYAENRCFYVVKEGDAEAEDFSVLKIWQNMEAGNMPEVTEVQENRRK